MLLTLLGTGTSQGVPVIGCQCPVCQSTDPRDNRLRTSALLQSGDQHILIDAGPDFRQQMLRAGLSRLDAILITHEHNDHAIGIDDVRPFNFTSGKAIRIFTQQRVADDLRRRFQYVFGEPIPGLPQIELIPADENDVLTFGDIRIQNIGVMHGHLPILGFRMGELTYLTDVKYLIPSELDKIRGTRYLVVNALQQHQHPTHMNLEEALAFIRELKPEKTWLTHISHHLGLTADVEKTLPEGVFIGYDGLKISF